MPDLSNPKVVFNVPNVPGQFSPAVALEGFRAAGRVLYCAGGVNDQIRLYLGASATGPWRKSVSVFGTQGAVTVETLAAAYAKIERVAGSGLVVVALVGDVDNQIERSAGSAGSGSAGTPIKVEATNDVSSNSNSFAELVTAVFIASRPTVVVTASASINCFDAGGRVSFRLLMDNAPIAAGGASLNLSVDANGTISIQGGAGNVTPGPHSIKLEWRAPLGATLRCRPDTVDDEHASLLISEFGEAA